MTTLTPTSFVAAIDDPWSLSLPERRHWLTQQTAAQRHWLPRLRRLVEPPAPGEDFPAFLLATPAFAALRGRVGDAVSRAELDTGTLDELQHFVDRYRLYLTP
jgi:hypothetical protein